MAYLTRQPGRAFGEAAALRPRSPGLGSKEAVGRPHSGQDTAGLFLPCRVSPDPWCLSLVVEVFTGWCPPGFPACFSGLASRPRLPTPVASRAYRPCPQALQEGSPLHCCFRPLS